MAAAATAILAVLREWGFEGRASMGRLLLLSASPLL